MKVKVQLLESIVTGEGCFHAGDFWECNTPEDARSMIAAGFAIPVEGQAPVKAEHEEKKPHTRKK